MTVQTSPQGNPQPSYPPDPQQASSNWLTPHSDGPAAPGPASPGLGSTPAPTDLPMPVAPPDVQPKAVGPLARDRQDPPSEATRAHHRALLGLLLVCTGMLYLWGLSANGWANAYYSAAAQAAGSSWKAWFFGSFDAANAITVDKPPASLWVMGLSVRLFGLSSWSVLVPQALMGVASVGVLYATVRSWFGPRAGLVAGAVLATTPVAALMFRFNNPDALLVLLLVLAAWAMTRATARGSLRWIMLAGVLVGFGFLAKMMQAFLVLPGFVAMYAVAAPIAWRKRLGHLLAAFATMIAAAGWWVAIVELWPASARPYIGGSQTNSMLELILGYNGFGRLTGNETGSVVPGGGTGGATSMWGATGWDRLFSASYGGQVAWLLPTALVMIVVMLWVSRRAPLTSRIRAAALCWGGWLLVTAAVISYSQGIIHEYYTVALAPAIGALIGIGSILLWDRRDHLAARITMAALTAGTAAWGYLLLARSATFLPPLRYAELVAGVMLAAILLFSNRLSRRLAAAAGIATVLVLLAGPTSYAIETAASPATGSLPSAGPAVSGTRGGPGGAGGDRGQFGPPPGFGQPGGTAQFPGLPPGAAPGQTPPGGAATMPRAGGGTGTAPGGAGGLLDASTPNSELTTALLASAAEYTWVAATTGSQSAAGYQLATGHPVISIGGFNGSDPAPTLSQFQQWVAAGRIHYYIPGGGRGGGGNQMGGSGAAAEIATWVAANYPATTIGGTTVYDLTQPVGSPVGSAGTTTAT